MDKQFYSVIEQICAEKNITKEAVISTVEDALAAAYKKDFGNKKQEVRVELTEGGEIIAFIAKLVVEKVEDPSIEIALEDALKLKKEAKVGDTVEIKDLPKDFGRIAAQTAKQVIIQRIREVERDMVFGEYKDKEGEVVNGTVQRIEGNNVIVDLGKASGILFPNEQISEERYYVGQRLKFFIVRVEQNSRGPQIVISRSHPGLVKRLFELEVPEILANIVEIKSIAREAGQRTKIAVSSNQEGVDPVGSCVGQRGVRVQAVMSEIGEEKIDIILFDEDSKVFISNALSPAKVNEIINDEETKKATVKVSEDQLSLAIGRQGQNVRLAAKLTGWNVDIEGGDEAGVESTAKMMKPVDDKRDLEDEILKAVESNGGESKNGENSDGESLQLSDATPKKVKKETKLSLKDKKEQKEKEGKPADEAPNEVVELKEGEEIDLISDKEDTLEKGKPQTKPLPEELSPSETASGETMPVSEPPAKDDVGTGKDEADNQDRKGQPEELPTATPVDDIQADQGLDEVARILEEEAKK